MARINRPRKILLALSVLLAFSAAACGTNKDSADTGPRETPLLSSTPTSLDDPALTETTSLMGQKEAAKWRSYSPQEQAEYRAAFELCNGWASVSSPTFDTSARKAADYIRRHGYAATAAGYGCNDGVAGLPLAGSGIPVPPD